MSKGKVLLALFALLVVPAVGYGQWEAMIDLNVGGATPNEIILAPGANFTLFVDLDSNQPVGGVQYALSPSHGDFMGAFDAADLNSFGSLFGPPFPVDPNLFGLGEMSSKMSPGPVSLSGLDPELIFRNEGETGQSDMIVFPGSLVKYTMTAPTTEDVFILSISDAILTNGQGNIGLDRGLLVDTLTVITPEPASVLLLLAGVPFLRRRRA